MNAVEQLRADNARLRSALTDCADYCATFFEEGREHRVVRAADAALASDARTEGGA